MEDQEVLNNIEQDSFKVYLDINVDIDNHRGYVKTTYERFPKNMKFMCASLLLWTAVRIIWLARSFKQYEIVNVYRDFVKYTQTVDLVDNPLSNQYVKIYCIGTMDKYNFNLDYEGFEMCEEETPASTVYSFYTLLKYIHSVLLPYSENAVFYNRLIPTLQELADYELENATPQQMKQICMGSAVCLAYDIVG